MNLKKKLGRYLRVNMLGPAPRLMKKVFTGARFHKGRETVLCGAHDQWHCCQKGREGPEGLGARDGGCGEIARGSFTKVCELYSTVHCTIIQYCALYNLHIYIYIYIQRSVRTSLRTSCTSNKGTSRRLVYRNSCWLCRKYKDSWSLGGFFETLNAIVNEGKKVQNENQGCKMEENWLKSNVSAGSAVLLADNFESVCTWKRYSLAMNIFWRVWKVILDL